MAVINESLAAKFNRGLFLSATIQSDLKVNACKCGGKFDDLEKFKGYEIPACNKCGENPCKLRIRAKVITTDGVRERVEIRYNQAGERLVDAIDCLTTIKMIKIEIANGSFDVRKYSSQAKRESYIFENFTKEYLEYHLKRRNKGDITPSGYSNKIKNTNHLVKYFSGVDISYFKNYHIENFRVDFDGSNAMLNHCLAELKTMFNYAHRFGLVSALPYIGEVKRSKTRTETMTLEQGLRILGHVKNETYRNIIQLLSEYPVRPGEVRALRWNDINFRKGTIRFDEHFSDEKSVEGRKSRKPGEKHSELILPLSASARFIFQNLPRSLNQDNYVFKGLRGDFVSSTALNRAWRNARVLAKLTPNKKMRYDLYEFKHAVLSELNSKTGGNLKTLENASGVDIKTLMERYVYSHDDLQEYFQ